jgi:hypothetical protein
MIRHRPSAAYLLACYTLNHKMKVPSLSEFRVTAVKIIVRFATSVVCSPRTIRKCSRFIQNVQ